MAQVHISEPRPGNGDEPKQPDVACGICLACYIRARSRQQRRALWPFLHYRDCSLSGTRALISSSPRAADMNERSARHDAAFDAFEDCDAVARTGAIAFHGVDVVDNAEQA